MNLYQALRTVPEHMLSKLPLVQPVGLTPGMASNLIIAKTIRYYSTRTLDVRLTHFMQTWGAAVPMDIDEDPAPTRSWHF
jgi:hypothetical protein